MLLDGEEQEKVELITIFKTALNYIGVKGSAQRTHSDGCGQPLISAPAS